MRRSGCMLLFVLAHGVSACGAAPPVTLYDPVSGLPAAQPNDNRTAGGRTVRGGVDMRLVAQWAAWTPDLDVDSAVTVMAFGEPGGPPRIPGPLLRARAGVEVRISVSNELGDSTLVVHGLRAGTVGDDTVRVEPGATREVRFVATSPGTFMYWGAAGDYALPRERMGRAGQLTGAIVIDAADATVDPAERILVMTVIDIFPDSTTGTNEDIWELAINGLSWPHTERMISDVGDTVRWRWVNGTYLSHPMHLHGFHFRVTGKGDGATWTEYDADNVRDVVTEFMKPGSAFAMEWVPTRAGNWLMHCHMAPHITPYPERPDSLRDHDAHDVAQHATQGMAGLVLGITTRGGSSGPPPPPLTRPPLVRVLVQQRGNSYGYVVQNGAEPAADSVPVPGTPIIVTRGETVIVTVVNRTKALTTVHWHGIELESIYDGVAGWSGAESNLAPLIAPDDSFRVSFTPPRAGTYIYHTHMDESAQLRSGAYGPLIVLEPGERFDPETDLVIMAGGAFDGDSWSRALNGRHAPAPLELRAGATYRLRLINILPAAPLEVLLHATDSAEVRWTPVAKDGAVLPRGAQRQQRAHMSNLGVGETYDFNWTPAAGAYELQLANHRDGFTLRQPVRVR
jgi:manganese oxidase